jgi:nicotinate phosphoribosyltransferase
MSRFVYWDVASTIDIQTGSVVSRVIFSDNRIEVSAFGFDAGAGLSKHQASRAAIVQVIKGRLEFTADGEQLDAGPGFWLHIAPSLDSVYKLVAYADRPVLKLSAGNATLPGAKQVFRNLRLGGDIVGLRAELHSDRESLLLPVMVTGQRVGGPDTLAAMRARVDAGLAALPERSLRLEHPEPVPVHVSDELARLRDRCTADVRSTDTGAARPATSASR